MSQSSSYMPNDRQAAVLLSVRDSGCAPDGATVKTINALCRLGFMVTGRSQPWVITQDGLRALGRAQVRLANRARREARALHLARVAGINHLKGPSDG